MMNSSSFESPKPYLLVHNLGHYTSFNVLQDVLKFANLLHKRGLDDSQSHTTVLLHAAAAAAPPRLPPLHSFS